jgi:NitT/TauT family transport system substrate-binding protein
MPQVLVFFIAVSLFPFSVLAGERVRLGYGAIGGAYVGIWIAHDAGLFAKEGLEDQMIYIPSGTQLAQVVVAGDVDIASINGSSAMAARLQGADLKVIGNQANKMIFSIYTKPEIKNVEDLKGKKLGITRFGSSTDISARFALRKNHPNFQKDITFIQLGSIGAIMNALQSGAIDAGIVSPPTLFAVEKLGFRELINITDMNLPFPNPALVSQGETLRNNPQLIDRFMRAYVRGVHRAKTDRSFALRSMAKYTHIDDSATLNKAYDLYIGKVLERVPAINMEGMQNALDDLARTMPAAKSAKPDQFIDFRFLENLEKSGFIKELYR